MRLGRWAVMGGLLMMLPGCAGSPTPAAGPSYTCCEAGDINREYRPGDTFALHWIVLAGEPGGTPTQVELNASLSGPYSTVGDLKATEDTKDSAAGFTFAAKPVRPTGRAGEEPVSIIVIPPTALPGLYNLTTSVIEPGGKVTGGSIVRIVPST